MLLLSLLVACVVFVIAVSGCAARVALSNSDKQRRADAVKVLKLVWGTTGLAGLVVAVVKLHESGVF